MSSDKINQLQLLQQNLHNILLQKQQIESQLEEINSALSGLENTKKAYQIVGNIMIASSKENLAKELKEKREVAEIRIKKLEEQEERLKKNLESIQQEVMKELKKK